MKLALCLLFVLGSFYATTVSAFRCGTYLVEIGEYKEDVSDICGDPDSMQSHTEIRSFGVTGQINQNFGNPNQFYPSQSLNLGQGNYNQIEIFVEEWIYDLGSNRLRQFLRFENGRLTDIRTLRNSRLP